MSIILRPHENQSTKRDPILWSKGFLPKECQNRADKSDGDVSISTDQMMDFKLNGLFAEVMEPNPGTRDATEQLKKVFTTAFGMEWKDDHDYSLIPFSCYFTMDNDKFMAITYWTAFSFLMDDQLRAEKDITVISKWQTKYRQGETSDTSPLDKILVKALDSVRKVLSADQYERHVKHALEWLESYKAVNHYDFADKVMPYERFFDLREWDSAHAILAIFAEMSCGYDPKEHDLTDNRIYRAFNAALGRHAVLCNEIYGLKKRIRDGLYKYSYMYVIMAEEGYSAQSAMDRIVYEIHDSWTIAMNYAEQLRLMRSKELYEYVVEMVRVTKGNLYWASKCRRYQAEL